MNKKQIESALIKHGLTVESVFVPFSQSRNAHEKSPSLNWKVTLKQNESTVLTTDYMAGCGHAPGYKQTFKRDYDLEQLIKKECETGFACKHMWTMGDIHPVKSKPIFPDPADVVYSLLMDAEVIDYPSFEDWAGNFGYEEDSRKAEQIYNDCMKIALKFRSIGESTIAELRELFQDY